MNIFRITNLIRKARRQRDSSRADCQLVEHELIHKHKIYKNKVDNVYKKYIKEINNLEDSNSKVNKTKKRINRIEQDTEFTMIRAKVYENMLAKMLTEGINIREDIKQNKGKLERVK